MKLGILSTAPNCYSTRRLREAAAGRGHLVKVLNTLRFAIDLSLAQPRLQYRGKTLSQYDAVLPRIGASISFFGIALVRQFGLLGSDVSVLSLTRGGETIPNPRKSRMVHANDRLLCFGKLSAMRTLIPADTHKVQKIR